MEPPESSEKMLPLDEEANGVNHDDAAYEDEGEYEDVTFEEEGGKTRITKKRGFTELEYTGDEADDLTGRAKDPSASSFFFASYPIVREYRGNWQRLKELVILNQNKFFLSVVIAVTVLGLFGILIYFSVKTWTINTNDNLVVTTLDGKVRGFNTTLARKFLGIPYARAPVGPLRWKPPQPHPGWQGRVLNASTPGAACMQPLSIFCPLDPNQVSEDCLYLNVYTPLNASSSANLPVLVWLHGGAFSIGEGDHYDGENLVGQGIIVVTINYRLGPFGYLALPELKDENTNNPTTGLYGILDQRAALVWVQRNIAAFGGNPDEVTLAGQSAGAVSACIHLTAPGSMRLFNKVIMQSGPCYIQTWESAVNVSRQFVKKLGCSGSGAELLACLRAKPANVTLDAFPEAFWIPAPDGTEVLDQPMARLQRGDYNVHGVLLGTNKDEDSFWLCRKYEGMTVPQYEEFIRRRFPTDLANQLLALYHVSHYPDGISALIDAFSDRDFKCPTRMAAELTSTRMKTYLYSYENQADFTFVFGPCFKSTHASELPFLFPSLLRACGLSVPPVSILEQSLSEFMIESWTAFVKYNDPNRRDRADERGHKKGKKDQKEVQWVPYSNTTLPYTILNREMSQGQHFREEFCGFWDSNLLLPAFKDLS